MLLFFVVCVVTFGVSYHIFGPKIDRTVEGDILLWYNSNSGERDFIFLKRNVEDVY